VTGAQCDAVRHWSVIGDECGRFALAQTLSASAFFAQVCAASQHQRLHHFNCRDLTGAVDRLAGVPNVVIGLPGCLQRACKTYSTRKISGSTQVRFSPTDQCRCGPVTRPVAPTSPILSPRLTRAPGSTSMLLRCA